MLYGALSLFCALRPFSLCCVLEASHGIWQDGREHALYHLDCAELLRAEALGNDALALRETMLLKLMHNALEANGHPDFLAQHVVLFCMRDFNALRYHGECAHAHRVVEMGGGAARRRGATESGVAGFVVTPHRAEYPCSPVPLTWALALWYATAHGAEDPLGVVEGCVARV